MTGKALGLMRLHKQVPAAPKSMTHVGVGERIPPESELSTHMEGSSTTVWPDLGTTHRGCGICPHASLPSWQRPPLASHDSEGFPSTGTSASVQLRDPGARDVFSTDLSISAIGVQTIQRRSRGRRKGARQRGQDHSCSEPFIVYSHMHACLQV